MPERYGFFSSVKDKCIRWKRFFSAIKVWFSFKMNTVGAYHDLCFKTDVLFLADVFENFINICLEYYGIDPCHYFSSPGLS